MSAPVVIMRTPAEAALIERFVTEKTTLPGAVKARAEAFARFEKSGLPGRRVESYHYTDLRNLWRNLAPDFVSKASEMRQPGFTEPQISFFNGLLHSVENLPAGVTCEPLAEALTTGSVTLGAAMGRAGDIVVDLNTAFVREGAVIRVAAGIEVPGYLHIAFIDAMAAGEPIHVHPRVIVEVGEGASIQLLESVTGSPGIAYQVNSVIELRLAARAKVEHVRLNIAGDAALVLSTLASTLGEEAELSSMQLSLGGHICRHQVFVTYEGENAKAAIRGATLLRGNQHHDTTLIVDHGVPHGESRELFRTVLDGAAQGVFQGKIIVRQHAQKTDGQMASNAILLSDEAGMANKPELEIFADDVVCAHGATCGALDENQLFYLQARGIPRPEAEALLVEAFVGEVIDTVSDENIREMASGLISRWMARRAA